MSLPSTSKIKAQLSEQLGSKADEYFLALKTFVAGKCSRTEFEEAMKPLLDAPSLVQLHNALIISLFDATTYRQAPPTVLSPPSLRKQPPTKRRRTDDYNHSTRSTRLKKWTLGVGKRERERIRNLDSFDPPFLPPPTDEISSERGVVLLPERGGPPGSRLPVHLFSISRSSTVNHIAERINLISAQNNLGPPARAVPSLMSLACEAKLKQLITHALTLTSTSNAITSISPSVASQSSHRPPVLGPSAFQTLLTIAPADLPNKSAAAMQLSIGETDMSDDTQQEVSLLKDREVRDQRWQIVALLAERITHQYTTHTSRQGLISGPPLNHLANYQIKKRGASYINLPDLLACCDALQTILSLQQRLSMRKRLPPLSNSSYFEELPNELLTIVLQFLEITVLLRCRQLSRRFNEMINHSIALEYRIELYANNLVDGYGPELPTKRARLALLRQHQIAWNNLSWSEIIQIPLNETELKIPFLTSWELLGGMLGLADHRSLRFIQLPSPLRGIPQKEWRFQDIGFNIRDFTMDRSLDLVVLLEHADFDGPDSDKATLRVHLHSLKTGLAHAKAHSEVVTYTSVLVKNEVVPEAINYVLQIFGDIVAVLVTKKDLLGTTPVIYSSELILWSWKSGDIQKVARGPIHGFTFLTQDLILLAVCRLDPEDMLNNPDHVSLDVLTIQGGSRYIDVALFSSSQKMPMHSFQFPPLSKASEHDANSVLRPELTLRSDYSCYWDESRENVPFATASSDRLIVLLVSNVPSRDNLSVFFRLSSLLKLLASRSVKDYIIPWDKWGPQHSRMTYRELDANWFCYVHGLKAVVPSALGEGMVEVWDFGPQSFRRGLELSKCRFKALRPPQYFYPSSQSKRQTYRIGAEALEESSGHNLWDTTSVFAQKVSTSLAYRAQALVSPLKNDRQVFMMTEDCLVSVIDDHSLFALCF